MSVKNLLELPERARALVLDTVSRLGWRASPFSDDNLSSKKLMPGFVFRCSAKLSKSSKWPKLNVVSAESAALCLESAIATYEASPLKKKLSKAELEEKLEMCILVARRLRTGPFII